MQMMLQPVLVLNASYEPIQISSAKSAMKKLVKGVAVAEESRDVRVHRDYMLPSVIRLSEMRKVPRRAMILSRKNILLRDGYTCQYCGKRLSPSNLTLDHVVPKAQGGQGRWENLVTACKLCNHKKADRTPEQAGMKLLRQPRALTIHTSRGMMRQMGHEEQAWRKYLYY